MHRNYSTNRKGVFDMTNEQLYTHQVHVPSKVMGWYTGNIDPEGTDKKVQATLDYLRRLDGAGEDGYTVWAHEIISGKHEVYTTRMFLDEVLCNGIAVYMKMELTDAVEDELMMRFDAATKELAFLFNRNSKLPGQFYVGNNEADGSLGVFYAVNE